MNARSRPVWLPYIGFVTFPAMTDAELEAETDLETGHVIFLSLFIADDAEIREQYLSADWRTSVPCAPNTAQLN